MEKTIKIACTGATTYDIAELVPMQGELKDLSEENYGKLKKEILELGFSEPISVWVDPDGQVKLLNGHQRTRTLMKMRDDGFVIPPIPVSLVEAESHQQAMKKILSLTSQYGEMTRDGLYKFMNDAQLSVADVMESFRFPEIDFNRFNEEFFVEKVDPKCDEDEIPERVEPRTKLGDIYKLGEHRLMCGDSTSIDAVEKLMDRQKADMVFTDPPYGVSFVGVKGSFYSGGESSGRYSAEEIKNDDLRGDDLSQLFSDAMVCAVAVAKNEAAFYLFFAINRSAETLKGLSACALEIRNWLIWDKGNVGFHAMGAQYKPNYEAFLYCHKLGQSPEWRGNFNQQTIWRHSSERLGLHPTMKPVSLIEQAFGNHPGVNTLDLFGGSGSTLIACEKTNRKCFMMELDPKYIDTIIARWEKYTGKKAELLNPAT